MDSKLEIALVFLLLVIKFRHVKEQNSTFKISKWTWHGSFLLPNTHAHICINRGKRSPPEFLAKVFRRNWNSPLSSPPIVTGVKPCTFVDLVFWVSCTFPGIPPPDCIKLLALSLSISLANCGLTNPSKPWRSYSSQHLKSWRVIFWMLMVRVYLWRRFS